VNDAINYVAMVLSVVSLIVTTVGFFASLKFYRDGVELQGKANDALTKIEEKTAFIQTQVGGMFERTLDAAIGKREALSQNFEDLDEQLERAKSKIVEESLSQIGAAGEQERKRLEQVVDSQIKLLRQKVETTRESAEDVAQEVSKYLSPMQRRVHDALMTADHDLTLSEVVDKTGMNVNAARATLVRLIQTGLADRLYFHDEAEGGKTAKYRPSTGQVKSKSPL
jgi:oligoendopeptidase F